LTIFEECFLLLSVAYIAFTGALLCKEVE